MFERFTQPARLVVTAAHEEAQQLGHSCVGTEHLVLALASDDGVAGQALRGAGVTAESLRTRLAHSTRGQDLDPEALRTLGIDLDQIRRSVEQTFGDGALDEPPSSARRRWGHRTGGKLRFSARARTSLERSLRQAGGLGDHHLGTEHLLLGVLDVTDSHGARLLTDAGVDVGTLRTSTIDLLRRSA